MPSFGSVRQVVSIPVNERTHPFLRVATPGAQAPISFVGTAPAITGATFLLVLTASAMGRSVEDP